jgi:lipopolysaccharide transport system ATP-binding protein
MKPILEIRKLSKQYKLGGKRIRRTENFRELMQRAGAAPFRALTGRTNDRIAKEELYTFWALKDVNFDVNQGDVIGIIGRNGAG